MAWQRRAEDGVRAGLAARSPMGVRLVIEPLRPLVRESGPRGQNHHAPLNAALIRSGSILAFAGYLLGHGTQRGLSCHRHTGFAAGDSLTAQSA